MKTKTELLKEITKEDSPNIEWLLEKENRALESNALSEVCRILIIKINQLISQIAEAEKEVESAYTETMYLNMQYYMEYCKMKGYVTPQEWLEKHKHF